MSCTEKISGAKKCAKKYLIYREICAIINMYALNDYWSPLKTSCERKCAVRTIFVVKPPRKAYSLTSSAFLEAGTPCPFLLFTPVFRGSLLLM